MLSSKEQFYSEKEEPVRSCLLALRSFILLQDKAISTEWKYGMPFFCYKGKMFCYMWVHPKKRLPYLGIVEGKRIDHPGLVAEKRSRMKILLLDPAKDLPLESITNILAQALHLYKSGEIKTNN